MRLLHTLGVRRGVAQELLPTCRFHLSFDNDRELECKGRALARLRLDPDFAPVHLNDLSWYRLNLHGVRHEGSYPSKRASGLVEP
jgi:hypothetical protein